MSLQVFSHKPEFELSYVKVGWVALNGEAAASRQHAVRFEKKTTLDAAISAGVFVWVCSRSNETCSPTRFLDTVL
jgi:hypothetical protein